MKANTPLKILVDLYRIAGRPPILGLYLPLKISFSLESDKVIKRLIALTNFQKYVEDDEFVIDDNIFQSGLFPVSWNEIEITIKLPRDNIHRFHNSVSELISFASVRNGDFPSEIYIVDLDYHSDDKVKLSSVIKIESICRLIKALSKLAHYHDNKATDGEPRLVFIQGSEGRSKSAILQPTITEKMLNYSDFDCTVVEQLQYESSVDDVNHHIEKRGIFRNTLVEFTNDNNYDFQQLIEKWTELRISYENNLSVYLSGFNFHKARKEVAAAELDFAEKISKTISDLTAKTLVIPVSLLASLGIWKLTQLSEQFIVFLGVVFTSITIHLLVMSQKKQLLRINHAKELLFLPFQSKLKQYPEELQGGIENTLQQLQKNGDFAKHVLNIFYVLCWSPAVIALGMMIYKQFNP